MDEKYILERMRNLCSRREYCKSDIRRKISRIKVEKSVDADAIIAKLCEERFIDEARYCAAFARDKSAIAGWGEKKIVYTLLSRKIPYDIIEEAFKEIEQDKSQKRMIEVLSIKYRSIKAENEYERKEKLLRYGVSRGYSYEQILSVYDNIRSDKRD